MEPKKKDILALSALLAGAGLLAGCAFWAFKQGYVQDIVAFINADISLLLFVLLMASLPLVGFPISVFLIGAGIKFGIPATIMLWLIILPIHTLICYAAAVNLRPVLIKLLKNSMGYSIPVIPPHREAKFSLLFLAIPGIPYAAKNYLLPLSGVAFRYCVVMNCIVQSILGLPFIILGKSGADQDPLLFSLALLFVVALFFTLRWAKSRFGS